MTTPTPTPTPTNPYGPKPVPVEPNTNTSTAQPAIVSGLSGTQVIHNSIARTAEQHNIVSSNSGMNASGGSRRSTKRRNKRNSKRPSKRRNKRNYKRPSKRRNSNKRLSKRGGATTPTPTPTPQPTLTVPAFKDSGATANSAAGNSTLLKANVQATYDNTNAPATTTNVW